MKKTVISLAISAIFIVALMLAACNGGDSQNTTTPSPENITIEESSSVDAEAKDPDFANPDIIIENGDAAGIEKLAKQAQNFEVSAGTVAKITGIFSKGVTNPSIQEPKDDKDFIGITMFIDGEWEYPEDRSEIEVIGSFVKGSLFMEFHVSPENITVKTTAE